MWASVAPTKTSKVERLMNLVIALLSTHGYLPADRIRASVIGYGECPTDEAFSRMFERDKSELRDLGIPLETGRVSSIDPTEGYRIKRGAYALPDIGLTADEAAAVAVATKLWESPERIRAAQNAVLKLRAAGVDVDPADEVTISTAAGPTGLRGSEAVLGSLLAAIDGRQVIRFQHRPTPVGAYATRTVEPWGVVTARGRWYLVGHDRDRDATRVFRLSRMTDVTAVGAHGEVAQPEGLDLRATVDRAIGDATDGGRATVWVADGRATALRRAGRPTGRRTIGGRDGEVFDIDVGALDWLAREVTGYGADALVLEPQSLRQDVLARLTAQAGGHR
ncbi:MAG: YafY family transcriptional regulator [Actinomycetia bacterium]|nr:YafY family transcriptional regulator [Actinomycetes bacterium]